MLSLTTYTGREFFPFEPHAEQICIRDIAHSLSYQCRYAGHISQFFSVAQHSVIVSWVVAEQFKLGGLMHDGSEAYLTDVPTPVKEALPSYKRIEDSLMHIIANKYDFQYPEPIEVKEADKDVLIWEMFHLFPMKKIDESLVKIPYEFEVWDHTRAEMEFVNHFMKYKGMQKLS